MSIKKQFLKTKPVCKVTFRLSKELTEKATQVKLVGDFNNWDTMNGIEMRGLKGGDFTTTLDLEKGKAYEFRYLVDGQKWMNDTEADRFSPTPFPNAENSVIIL